MLSFLASKMRLMMTKSRASQIYDVESLTYNVTAFGERTFKELRKMK